MQIGDDMVHRQEHRPPLVAVEAGQPLVPEDAAVEMLHHVESAADDAVVLAQRMDSRHRHRGLRQCAHDAKLAIDGMRARQQRARRLAAQHVVARAGAQTVGRVRLTAGETLGDQRAAKPGNVLR
jgi:hypothetical protein